MNRKIEKIEKSLKSIEEKIEAYKKVDATLSDKTLSVVGFIIDLADETLEKGFVFDSCEEIEKAIKKL